MKVRTLKLTGRLREAVFLAKWAEREELTVEDAAQLVMLAQRAKRAGERHCNEGTDESHAAEVRAGERFERLAEQFGYRVDWPGLWPCLSRGGVEVHLP